MNRFMVDGDVVGSALVLTVLIAVLIAVLCLTTISAGYAGVVYNRNGGIEDNVLGQGWHFVAPWKRVIAYPVSTETVHLDKGDSFNITTKDGKPVNVDVVYSYHMNVDKLPQVFSKFRGRKAEFIEAGFIKDRLKESVQMITSQYGVLDVYGEKRAELNAKVFNEFKGTLEPHGIIIETFNFSRIEPDADSMKAIQAKVDAQQELERLQIEKEQAEVMAEKRRIDAKGVADALLIETEGQAKSNDLLQKSVTNQLVEYIKWEKWDGVLPKVSGGNQLLQMGLD